MEKAKKLEDYVWISPNLDTYRIGVVDWLSDEVYGVYRNERLVQAGVDDGGIIVPYPVMYDNIDDAIALFNKIKANKFTDLKVPSNWT